MFTEYHKIETPYERDMDGSKKLIEGKFRSKYVKFLRNAEWIFTEKIDGTNIRVCWDGHTFVFKGRTDRANLPAGLVLRLQQLFLNNEMEELVEQMFGEKEVMFIGEGYGAGIQAVGKDYIPDGQDFILFDVCVEGKYLDHDNVVEIAKALGLDMTPVVLTGTIDDAVKLVKSNPVSLRGTCVMEGVVGRLPVNMYDSRGNRMIVKIKCHDFLK
jgi:hypothetical protein